MGSYASKGPMDDLISQMKETDSQLSLLDKQIKRHEEYGDMWNDDENLNYFHMLEQHDELKKKKKKQEDEYQTAVETAERESERAQAQLNNPVNLTDDEISANQVLLQNLSQGASIAKYQDMLNSGVKPKEIDRIWGAISNTNTLSNPYISDDDLWANQTRLGAMNGSDKELEDLRNAGKKTMGVPTYEMNRTSDALTALNQSVNQGKNPYISDDDLMANITRLDALRWQAEHPGVKQNEVDRVYDAIKNTDTQKNPYISDDDLMANQTRLEALGGSWGAEDERKKKQKYFGLEDIPNRQYTDEIRRLMGDELYDKYLAKKGKTDTELRGEYLDMYRELLEGQSGSMKRDAVTQMIAQDIMDWDAGRNMGELGRGSLESRTTAGYNRGSGGLDGGGRSSPNKNKSGTNYGGFDLGGRSAGKQSYRRGTSSAESATDASGYLDDIAGGAEDVGKKPWDSWDNYEKVTANGQEYAKVGDRLYSRHAVNRMQPSGNRFGPNIYLGLYGEDYGRSVDPQFVEDVIHSVKPIVQNNGNLVYISGTVKIVTNQQGSVITIVTYLK